MSGNASSLVNIFANKMQALQIPRTQRVTVALSGGPDSLALALLTAWWGNTTGTTLLSLLTPSLASP